MESNQGMLTVSSNNAICEIPGLSRMKSRRSSSSSSLGSLRKVSSRTTLAKTESRKAHFRQHSDSVDGDYVISYLEQHPEIEELTCDGVISDEHVHAMHRLFVNYHTYIHLTSLELPNNGLTEDSGSPLAKILQFQNETIRRLNLAFNPFGTGVAELFDPLTTESYPSRIRVLNLSDTQISKSVNHLAAILRDNKSIEELDLSNNNLRTKGMKALAPALAVNSTLQTLDISFNDIKKKGAAYIADSLFSSNLSVLRVLNVKCNNLGAGGLEHLTKLLTSDGAFHGLEGLYAGSNGVGPKGALLLGTTLKHNYRLKELLLEDNEIGDAGAIWVAEGLLQNDMRTSAMERLVLAWNAIGLDGVKSIAEVLKRETKLASLDLTGNNICCAAAEALSSAFDYNLSLKELILTRNQVKGPGATALGRAMAKPGCAVEALHWQENPIPNDGRATLEAIPVLRRNLRDWLDQFLKDLAAGSIASIDLRSRDVGDEELRLLTNALQATCPPLRLFRLSGVGLTSRSLVPFMEDTLGSSSKIMRLYLDSCDCGDDVWSALSLVLNENTSLTVLSITNASMSGSGATFLAKGLKGNANVQRLNLNGNKIGDDGALALGSILPHPSIVSLSMTKNSLTDQVMSCKSFTLLEELYLSGNEITDRGILQFSGFLTEPDCQSKCRLRCLGLGRNRISVHAAKTIKGYLPATTFLEHY